MELLQAKKNGETNIPDDFMILNVENGSTGFSVSIDSTFELQSSADIDRKPKGLISKCTDKIKSFLQRHKTKIRKFVQSMILLVYLAYAGYALSYEFGDEGSWRLLIGTVFGVLLILKKIFTKLGIYKKISQCVKKINVPKKLNVVIKWILYVAMVTWFVIYIGTNIVFTNPENLVSMVGIVIFLLALFLTSTHKTKVNWHTVFWGMALQFVFALIVLKTEWGRATISYLGQRFMELSKHADSGSEFVFTPKYYKEFRFLFSSMPKVLVFCAIISVLNYLGVVQFIIKNIGGFLAFCLGSSPIESLTAAANTFLGNGSVCAMFTDYLPSIPLHELFCIFTTGMSTIAGTQMIVFIGYGIPAHYLLAANTMSAPAALAVSKLSMPNIGNSKENKISDESDLNRLSKAHNMLEAISHGCDTGLKLVVNIVVNVLVFISLLELVNSTLKWFGDRAGVAEFSLEFMFSYILWPVAFIMGVDTTDCHKVASLLGLKAMTNPGIAYIQLGKYIDNKASLLDYQMMYNDTMTKGNHLILPQWNKTLINGILQNKSEVISTYALCGGSCITVLGIGLGAMGSLAPTRKLDMMNIAVRSLLVSSVASLVTACVAGLLFEG